MSYPITLGRTVRIDISLHIGWRTLFDEKTAKGVRICASRPSPTNPFDSPQTVLKHTYMVCAIV